VCTATSVKWWLAHVTHATCTTGRGLLLLREGLRLLGIVLLEVLLRLLLLLMLLLLLLLLGLLLRGPPWRRLESARFVVQGLLPGLRPRPVSLQGLPTGFAKSFPPPLPPSLSLWPPAPPIEKKSTNSSSEDDEEVCGFSRSNPMWLSSSPLLSCVRSPGRGEWGAGWCGMRWRCWSHPVTNSYRLTHPLTHLRRTAEAAASCTGPLRLASRA
jgi:hypothetical protein